MPIPISFSKKNDRLTSRPGLWLGLTAAVLALAAALPAAMAPSTAVAQTTGNREPTLRERLLYGLEASRPTELAFIDAVADTVDRGELPEKLVDRFFFWSRKRAERHTSGSRRAIVYFQPALQIQAKKLGITIASDP
ncbi:hypothetical protein Mal64_17530 [Pseudobythopirellula maris]|uniref:Lytic murein transglycosylase n=1 Tax=Pseudobythopirellula maris TaxID=2527991 RepID=A0A5C5ZLF0_9BACT|nr:hypothetical protein [Pseudobythopirellula maris]TWT88274.1 hypothetical protein Mal64_17530 [Pseudobythopirellula maris]